MLSIVFVADVCSIWPAPILICVCVLNDIRSARRLRVIIGRGAVRDKLRRFGHLLLSLTGAAVLAGRRVDGCV